jgi:hypothetical protein
MTVVKLKASQRLRVIVDGVSFYTKVKQVRDGVGDNTLINRLVASAVETIEREDLSGYGTSRFGHQFQVSIL